MANPRPAVDIDPSGIGPPVPCTLVTLLGGDGDRMPVSLLHPRLRGLDWFPLDLTGDVSWLDDVVRCPFPWLVGDAIPTAVRDARPPRFAVGTIVVAVDLRGESPVLRIGEIHELTDTIADLPEYPLSPDVDPSVTVATVTSAMTMT